MFYCSIYVKPELSKDDYCKVNGKYKYGVKCPKCGNKRYVRTDIYKKSRFGLCKECAEDDKKSKSHYDSRIYTIWEGINQRCYNENNKYYCNYGERGIKVCKEWRDSAFSFISWAFLNGYEDSLTIERINNNGNYCPSNCTWVTRYEQMQNTREIRKNNKSGYKNIIIEKGKYRVFKTFYGKKICDKKFKTLDEALEYKEKILNLLAVGDISTS